MIRDGTLRMMVALVGLLVLAAGLPVPAGAQGNVLRVAIETNPPTLDPHMSTAFVVRELSGHVFEGLINIGEDYGLVPQLAKSWEISADGKTYTFFLREGVRFHNGKVMTAADVKASIERFMKVGARARDLAVIDSIEIVDDHTVRIRLKEALGAFPGLLANPVTIVAIMPKELVEGATEHLRVPNLVGTGPFLYESWVPDQRIVLKRFESYTRDTSQPKSGLAGDRMALVDEVRIIPVLETASRVAGIERGEYDVATSLPWTSYNRLAEHAQVNPVVIRPFTQVILQLNQNIPPFNDLKVRQAVQAGLNMDVVMRAVAGGQTAAYRLQPSLFFPEQEVWYSDVNGHLYDQRDLAKARRLLQESSYDGQPIILLTNRDIDWLYRTALAVQPQLEAIGFKVELRVLDWPGQVAAQRDGRGGQGDFHIATNGVSTRPEPSAWNYLFQCGATYESYGYCDGEMDAYLMAGMVSLNPAERRQAYVDVQKRFHETIPFLRIGDLFILDAFRTNVHGFETWFLRRYWNVERR